MLRAIMDISAHSNGPSWSPVFACAGKTDPQSSSHPLADLCGHAKESRHGGSFPQPEGVRSEKPPRKGIDF